MISDSGVRSSGLQTARRAGFSPAVCEPGSINPTPAAVAVARKRRRVNALLISAFLSVYLTVV
ncbi:MAG: hypothetical protein ACYTBX_05635 [Planctomycetota bacterium]